MKRAQRQPAAKAGKVTLAVMRDQIAAAEAQYQRLADAYTLSEEKIEAAGCKIGDPKAAARVGKDRIDRGIKAAIRRFDRIAERAIGTSAATRADLLAKAEILAWVAVQDADDSAACRLGVSFLADLGRKVGP